jgi:hypothetical protein
MLHGRYWVDTSKTNFTTVLPRGRNFGRKSQKGPQKNLRGRKNWRPNFYQIFIKRAEKGPNFFETLILGIICGSSEISAFLSQFNPHSLVEFVSCQVICSSKNKFSCGAEFFCLADEFFPKSGRILLKRVGNTVKPIFTSFILKLTLLCWQKLV